MRARERSAIRCGSTFCRHERLGTFAVRDTKGITGMWLITYDDGHGRPVMIRRVATEHEALDQACVLRRWYDVLSIEGPEGQRHDVKAITEWCLAYSK